jgi:hypothetical protein
MKTANVGDPVSAKLATASVFVFEGGERERGAYRVGRAEVC